MNHRWVGFSSTITVSEAQEILFDNIPDFDRSEIVSIFNSLNRKVYSPIIAPRSLPGFRRSAMDGYAVIASETHGSSDTNPLQLKISGKVDIGDTELLSISPGNAIRIATGAPVPNNSTAVIKIEDCEELTGNILEIYSPVSSSKNIAEEDEDVKIGEEIVMKNHVLKPWDISLLLGLGITEVKVYCKPLVSILSTGNELIDVTETPILGQVVDSNRTALEMWLKHLGAEIVKSDTCSDDLDIIKERLLEYPECDLIITTGGTSVGTLDYMKDVIEDIGESWVRGVSIRPGKPVILGKIKESTIIALPGYPLAAFLNFNFFAVPLLQKITGLSNYWEHEEEVILAQSIASRSGIRDIARLREKDGEAELIRITGAGILSSLTRADYILEIPEDLEGYVKGARVIVKRVEK